jgi:hypothetical protein
MKCALFCGTTTAFFNQCPPALQAFQARQKELIDWPGSGRGLAGNAASLLLSLTLSRKDIY